MQLLRFLVPAGIFASIFSMFFQAKYIMFTFKSLEAMYLQFCYAIFHVYILFDLILFLLLMNSAQF